jgi:hypothetical protein
MEAAERSGLSYLAGRVDQVRYRRPPRLKPNIPLGGGERECHTLYISQTPDLQEIHASQQTCTETCT